MLPPEYLEFCFLLCLLWGSISLGRCRGRILPVFGLPQQACRHSDREDHCCGCFVLQKTVHRLIYGSASTSVREVRISSISSSVTGGRVRPTWCASSRYKGWGGSNAAHREWWRRSIRFRGSRESATPIFASCRRMEVSASQAAGAAARTSGAAGRLAGSGGLSLPMPLAGGGVQPPGNRSPGCHPSGQRQGGKAVDHLRKGSVPDSAAGPAGAGRKERCPDLWRSSSGIPGSAPGSPHGWSAGYPGAGRRMQAGRGPAAPWQTGGHS